MQYSHRGTRSQKLALKLSYRLGLELDYGAPPELCMRHPLIDEPATSGPIYPCPTSIAYLALPVIDKVCALLQRHQYCAETNAILLLVALAFEYCSRTTRDSMYNEKLAQPRKAHRNCEPAAEGDTSH